jgi:hypothetical protein
MPSLSARPLKVDVEGHLASVPAIRGETRASGHSLEIRRLSVPPPRLSRPRYVPSRLRRGARGPTHDPDNRGQDENWSRQQGREYHGSGESAGHWIGPFRKHACLYLQSLIGVLVRVR